MEGEESATDTNNLNMKEDWCYRGSQVYGEWVNEYHSRLVGPQEEEAELRKMIVIIVAALMTTTVIIIIDVVGAIFITTITIIAIVIVITSGYAHLSDFACVCALSDT